MKSFKKRFRWRNALASGPQPGPGPIVRSICISMVKNEQDVIEPFLRHNRPFFDAMIVLDNLSTDLTRTIALACARELDGIFVTDLPRFDYAQAEFMTAALHFAQSAFFADFVCFLDADEFIGAPDRAGFEKSLSIVPVGAASHHAWQTFLPDPDVQGDPNADPLARMTYRRKKELPKYSKGFLRMGGGVNSTISVQQGNHGFSSTTLTKPALVPVKDVPIKHFPVRSAEQLLTKGVVGWLANIARNPEAAHDGSAYQWKRIFNLAGNPDASITPVTLSNEAMAYAQTETPVSFAANAVRQDHGVNLHRSYSDGKSAEHFRTVALSVIRAQQPPKTFSMASIKDPTAAKSGITNAFDDSWHWQNLFLDVAPFRYITEKYRPESAFDVGCGNGLYLRLLQDAGIKTVFGVDGIDPSATVLDAAEYAKVDLQLPYSVGKRFDVVFCLEVVEHIAPETTDVLFDTIAAHAKDLIVFSMAEPGQPGNGHINCLAIPDVLDHWKKRGWTPDLVETLGVRALSTMSWFRRNILVLKPAAGRPDDGADAALRKIAAMSYTWYAQKPGIRQAAFQEPFPADNHAYRTVQP